MSRKGSRNIFMSRRNARKPHAADAPSGRLIGYARVSTDEQSLDLQLDALRAAGVKEANLHMEKVSGADADRPGLEAALLTARRGDTIVVWRLDRFGRSARDILNRIHELRDRGVHFLSIKDAVDTTTSAGKLLLTIHSAFAQFERDVISERTRAGMAAYVARGGKLGRERVLSDEQIAEGKAMWRNGVGVRALGRHFNVSHETVRVWITRPAAAEDAKSKRKRTS